MLSGRLFPPEREAWAWVAGPVALSYWRRWTVGATRHIRGWFGGSDLASVQFGGGDDRRMMWSMARWAADEGERATPDKLEAHGLRVWEGCRALGLERTHGSPGSAAVALLRLLSGGRLPFAPHEQQEWCEGAVYGGRAEVWRPGVHGACVQWDRRSAYVAHLADPVPDCRSARWAEHPDLRVDGVSDAVVDVPESMEVPVLPVRAQTPEGKRTVYPHGRLRGRWTHLELRAAVDRGATLRTLGPGVEYHRMVPAGPYQAFAARVWDRRRAWPDAKRVGVALVGRMHSGRVQRRAQPIHVADDLVDPSALAHYLGAADVILGHGGLMGRVGPDVAIYRDEAKLYSPHVNMPAAVHVLARARLALLGVLEANRGRVVACATDGAIFTGWGEPSWPVGARTGESLGAWRVEARARSAEVVGPVHYRMRLQGGGEKVRTAGLMRELADKFFKGRAVAVKVPLPLEAGRRVGTIVTRRIRPDSVSVTGGRVDGRVALVDVGPDGTTFVVR